MNKVAKIRKVIILDNIRSVYNVGSIFRTSDALGIDKIYLCGYTPTPIDRFGRARYDLAKVALGAEKDIPSEYFTDTKKLIKKLKKEGFQIIAIEQDKKSVDFKKVSRLLKIYNKENKLTDAEFAIVKLLLIHRISMYIHFYYFNSEMNKSKIQRKKAVYYFNVLTNSLKYLTNLSCKL